MVAEHVGGGFGAKQNLTPETVAAIELARAARAPVRVALDRGEEISLAGYRPSAEIELALLASDSDGPRALQVRAYGDAGVSVGSSIAALCRMIYPAAAKDLQDFDVVNHMPPGLPFRGPGAPLACWALEQAVDEAAHRLGEDPIALRRRWDPLPQRQRLYAWVESLPLWRDRPRSGSQQGRFRRGVGRGRGELALHLPAGLRGRGGRRARAALRGHRRAGHRHGQPQRAREHGRRVPSSSSRRRWRCGSATRGS